MILDNQNLPEIVVSREEGGNNNANSGNTVPCNYNQLGADVSKVSRKASEFIDLPKNLESPKHHRASVVLGSPPPLRRHNQNQQNHNEQQKQANAFVEHPMAGWDDAPGSPHRVPLVTNNNGSPRLTNRIANIYGVRHQVNKPTTVHDSPHGSPRHQAITRIVSPNPDYYKGASKPFSKNDLILPNSPKFNKKINNDDMSELVEQPVDFPTRIDCNGSPKRFFYLNQSPSHSPGYHNPYQQTTSFVKSPLLQTNETKFTYDSPKHSIKGIVEAPKHNSKPPLSPRHTYNSEDKTSTTERRLSNDNSFNVNEHTTKEGVSRSQKSRIPCKIPVPNQIESSNMQNNLAVVKPVQVGSPKRITKMPLLQSNVPFTSVSNKDNYVQSYQNTNNIQYRDSHKLNLLDCNTNDVQKNTFKFSNLDNNYVDVNHPSYNNYNKFDINTLVEQQFGCVVEQHELKSASQDQNSSTKIHQGSDSAEQHQTNLMDRYQINSTEHQSRNSDDHNHQNYSVEHKQANNSVDSNDWNSSEYSSNNANCENSGEFSTSITNCRNSGEFSHNNVNYENSVEFFHNNANCASWNTNNISNDSEQRMSIDDKFSLKKSSVDSLRPRTNSLGSWSHSCSSHSQEDKSFPSGSLGGSVGGFGAISDTDSGMAESVSSKMVLIKCKDGTYLSRVFLNTEGIQGVKVVGRVGSSATALGGVAINSPRSCSPSVHKTGNMSAAPSPLHQPSLGKGGAVETCESISMSANDGEFDHDSADYQWLLDYDSPFSATVPVMTSSSTHSFSSSDGFRRSGELCYIEPNKLTEQTHYDTQHNRHFSDHTFNFINETSNSAEPNYLINFPNANDKSEDHHNIKKYRTSTNVTNNFSSNTGVSNNIICNNIINDRSNSPSNKNNKTASNSEIIRNSYSRDSTVELFASNHTFVSGNSSNPKSLLFPPVFCCEQRLSSAGCRATSSKSSNKLPLSPKSCCPNTPSRIIPHTFASATNNHRYRESYTRESLGGSNGGQQGSVRMSVLDHNPEPNLEDLSYETLSRNLDANLAEIDMDEFRSDDIHQLLVLPSVCAQCHRDESEGATDGCVDDMEQENDDGTSYQQQQSTDNTPTRTRQRHQHHPTCRHNNHRHSHKLSTDNPNSSGFLDEDGLIVHPYEDYELEEEEFSGVSGDISLYQSGPLFSPLKDPPPLGNTTFSVDSLDCESLHEDLILTCQANKDNYTIAFEGSFIQYSEDSDYHEAGESDTTGSGSWAAGRLEGRSPGPPPAAMTHSDQPYTTWSRVGRKPAGSGSISDSNRTPGSRHLSPAAKQQHQQQQQQQQVMKQQPIQQQQDKDGAEDPSSKSNSMPNLMMRRSLMRQSLVESASGHCVKVFDLQNSLRSSQTGGKQITDASGGNNNSFSLVRLFMKQKSLSKEAISLSSSCTSRSHDLACCTSSENQSGVDSSDWPMNSQSDDMDGSASPVPPPALRHNQAILDRAYRRRSGSDINTTTGALTARNVNTNSGDYTTSDIISPNNGTNTNTTTTTDLENDGSLVNNNNAVNQILDNTATNVATFDNNASFEDSVKEVCPCSKPPVTSPIREEPEGMDISFDSRCENKLIIDQSETETKSNISVSSNENRSVNINDGNASPARQSAKESNKNPTNKNTYSAHSEDKHRSQSPATPKRSANRRENSQRQRQDSGNTSSGYASTKGSTEKIRRSSDSGTPHHTPQRPRPKPRALKQMADQCLQTSNLKVSVAMNTSTLIDRKDIYIYYPNYALPDLSFLKDKKYSVDSRIFLVPQHYRRSPIDLKKIRDHRTKRPFSCNDMEKLRKRGLGHVKDWDSLNVLLPKELKEMLSDNTECMETVKPSFCISPKSPRRPTGCDLSGQRQTSDIKASGSNSSLNSTQPSSGYRGSSTMLNDSSEANASLETDQQTGEHPPVVPKRSVSLLSEEEEGGDLPPPRPPLPRGILRKTTSLKDDSPKQCVKKRHSAADAQSGQSRDDVTKRRSLQEPMEVLAKKATKGIIMEQPVRSEGDGGNEPSDMMGCSCINNTCTGFCGKGLKKKNLMRVSELPDVSSHEEFTEQDLDALRSQVSNFLVGRTVPEDMVCELCPKKSVSFAERGGGACKHMRNTIQTALNSGKSQSSPLGSSAEERPMVYDTQDKKTLVLSVRAAVEKLVIHFSQAPHLKTKTSSSTVSCVVSQLTLDKLCPAVYALLSDGLQPSLHSLFGKINNSVWRVIEATSQMGASTKALNDLVMTLNSEDCLTEGPMKFNAFVFGLLNIRSLDSWLSYLRTRESILQKHYHPEAFLYMANTATRGLYDDLLLAIRPLSLMPLHLDLLFEYKVLHASLLKMEERLLLHTSSTNQSPIDRPATDLLDHLLAAKETKEFKNTAAAQQDRVKALMRVLTSPDATEADLLQTVASSVTKERSRSPRPRSCYENTAVNGEDLHSSLKKRWSNVQLGSKLLTAIDKLMLEEVAGTSGTSSDYTDTLDNPKPNKIASNCPGDDVATDLRISDISNKDDDISERSATDKDTENEKGQRICPTSLVYNKEQESEGEKFRRLQLKWERMAGCENKSGAADNNESFSATNLSAATSSAAAPTKTPSNSPLASPAVATEDAVVSPCQASRDKVVSPNSGIRSRIPRPVSMTSPQRPFKPFEPSKEKTSPQIKPPMHTKPIGCVISSSKDLPKPAPRRSLKDRSLDKQEESPSGAAVRPMSVRSRITPKSSSDAVTGTGNRASSMPGRHDSADRSGGGTSHGWGGRYDNNPTYKKVSAIGGHGPRSASHGRRLIPGVVPRYVQTLHHRLATDNGHLSFNRGDVLTVVVEVDDRYLLCCYNDRKGLVPRASVIVCSDQ